MKAKDPFTEMVMERLEPLASKGELKGRSMFGGFGIYLGGKFFAIVYKGRLFFKTDRNTASKYSAQGMEPFRPGAKQTLKNYFEVPPDIIEDGEELCRWGEESARIA